MVLFGDCREILKTLPPRSVQCVVTSPPYWGLRDYGVADQLGLESTMQEYIANMVEVFSLVKAVLADDGVCWINLGDSYLAQIGAGFSGNKRLPENNQNIKIAHPFRAKNIAGIPWRVAFALQYDGWYLRQDIIWSKPNPMPESVRDRCTKAHEYIFMLTKSAHYYYDADAIKEPAIYFDDDRKGRAKEEEQCGALRNKRSVWTVASEPYSGAHFATYPPKLIEPMILASSRVGDTVLDPFFGSGTTGQVAHRVAFRVDRLRAIGNGQVPRVVATAWRILLED